MKKFFAITAIIIGLILTVPAVYSFSDHGNSTAVYVEDCSAHPQNEGRYITLCGRLEAVGCAAVGISLFLAGTITIIINRGKNGKKKL